MLVISILAPSIEVLCKSSYDNVMVIDFNEEENNKQETDQKFDQKELFFTDSIEGRSINFSQEIAIIQTTLVSYSDFSAEIVLPPPQDLI